MRSGAAAGNFEQSEDRCASKSLSVVEIMPESPTKILSLYTCSTFTELTGDIHPEYESLAQKVPWIYNSWVGNSKRHSARALTGISLL